MKKKYTMHVISGTHWDREWRYTAEQSKSRLVELVDYIIQLLESDQNFKYYCVDGGTVVLEDYLTIRPENKDRIKKLVSANRMQILNWYTLPEMFTVAPEAIIRNLLVGKKMADEFGGGIKSGYTATSYGQTSQLPQIYQGFGINTAIFYRGTNKYVLPPFFKWQGLDGSQLYTLKTFDEVTRTNWFFYVHQPLVLGKKSRDLTYSYDRNNIPVHMCDEDSYERAFTLLKEELQYDKRPESLKMAIESIKTQTLPYAVENNLLALNMEDNDRPYALLPQMIEDLNGISPDIEIVQDSIDNYMNLLVKQTASKKLHIHKGELRYPAVEYGFNALLGAVYSSRVKLKILNEEAETGLFFHAEPLASLAYFYGNEYPRTYLERALLALLKNHAHDSICGAAVDLAHQDMLYNFSVAKTVAEEVIAQSTISLFKSIDTVKDFNPTDITITFFNTLPLQRREVVLLIVDVPSAKGIENKDIGIEGIDLENGYFDIVDKDGNELLYEQLSSEDIRIVVERDLDTKSIKCPMKRMRLLLEVTVPELGYKTYAIRFRGPDYAKNPETIPDRPLIARANGILENKHLRVTINSNGTFSLFHKQTNRLIENLHYYTDSGEVGSTHISKKPERNTVVTSLGCNAVITMIESNLLRGIFKIDLKLTVPAETTKDESDRLKETKDIHITTWLILEKDSNFLRIKTIVYNIVKDHKLCVDFPSYINTDYVYSESAFAVEKRSIRWTNSKDNFEHFFSTQPMQNFIDLSDGNAGLAILNKGLREYEIMDDRIRTISITLLRTHRTYMTANTNMIPDELDKYTGSHSFGRLEYNYAIYPHVGDWQEGKVLQAAYKFKVKIKSILGVPISGTLESSGSFISIDPVDKIMISSLKILEDGSGIVLRIWNITSAKQNVKIKSILPIKSIKAIRIDETPIENLNIKNKEINFVMGPHKIYSLLLNKK